MSVTSTSEIKVVGKSGQISLGKRYAGKTLELQRLDDGSLLLRSEKIRGIAYRDGDFLRIISLHPDHDSAYER